MTFVFQPKKKKKKEEEEATCKNLKRKTKHIIITDQVVENI